ncbi:hypothetical protein B0T25DRAFT_6339 [Lasiosphaeria hispida]|uniref:Ankyrin repeat protein n=1 Tax=Lasiosphaeria hispida TaxID=260671 RepID=A0AAJ0HT65_9PEZI|nr:hypothetical protein B0T25DRAFT_6339 [Lasiosphaeria hispida]
MSDEEPKGGLPPSDDKARALRISVDGSETPDPSQQDKSKTSGLHTWLIPKKIREAGSSQLEPMDATKSQAADPARAESAEPTPPSQVPDISYRLEVVVLPVQNQPHYVDIVAVHDYDETTANWTYKDKEQVLRQEIDNIRLKKNKLQDEAERASLISHEDRVSDVGREKEAVRRDTAGSSDTRAADLAPKLQFLRKSKKAKPSPTARLGVAGLQTEKHDDEHLGAESREPGSNRPTEAGSSRASSTYGRISGPNWLQDTTMLPRTLPGARVLTYTYPKLNLSSESDQSDYLDKAASSLLNALGGARQSAEDSDRVPIVFIGAGFGGIIVQKMIALAASKEALNASDKESQATGKGKSAEMERLPLILDHIASVIFLDTSFPEEESEDSKGFFPANVNVRMCAIVEVMEEMEWKDSDVESVWNEFWTALCQRGHDARVLWFHSTGRTHGVPKKRVLLSEDGCSQVITLHPLSIHRLRRLTSFPSPDDSGYKCIASRMCDDLMLRAVRNQKFKDLQLDLMRAGSSVNAKDERGLSLLHRAATAPNPVGVNMLLGNQANSQVRDLSGQTPLHRAIRMFCKDDPGDEATQEQLKKIIAQLLDFTRKSELYNSRDNDGMAPHDLLHDTRECSCYPDPCKHDPIRELLNSHQPIVSHRLEERKDKPWKGWGPPASDGLAHKACVRSKAIVAEFYDRDGLGDSREDRQLLADYYVPSVLDLVYQKGLGPAKILSKLAERHVIQKGDVCCRWIHVPANNEQWLHDLFIRLRLIDSSMNGQRHNGHTIYNRYMVAQAKRYKQEVFLPAIEIQTASSSHLDSIPEDPDATDTKEVEDAGFKEILRAEGGGGWPSINTPKELSIASDAIALFMPILSYEKHRERKVMSRAIRRMLKPRRWRWISAEERAKNANIDTSLIEAYLTSDKPVHCRRTLDQYSYYMLETTESRDIDQVVYKWARKQQNQHWSLKNREPRSAFRGYNDDGESDGEIGGPSDMEVIYRWNQREEGLQDGDEPFRAQNYRAARGEMARDERIPPGARHRPVIMIDQLWLWVLPDGTIVSSLPSTADAGEPYNLKRRLEMALFDDPTESPIQSADDLVHAILKICLDFFKCEGPCGVKFQDCFQYSISDIAEDEARMYTKYKQTVKFLEALGPAAFSNEKQIDTFSQVTNETKRLVEIMDVQDELSIVDSVLVTQKNVLQMLIQQMHKRSDSDKKSKQKIDAIMLSALRDSSRIQEAIRVVENNISSVAEMISSAKRVQEDLKQLLDFKQQQSNAWETRFARKLAEQGQKQNNIMLVFTLVTIVFLPLSFISSFFALSIDEFPRNEESGNTAWPIREVSGYLFGISIAVSLPLIAAAFYINPISRMVKGKRKRDLRYFKQASADRPEGHDSDDSDSDGSDDSNGTASDIKKPKRKRKRAANDSSSTFYNDEDDDYAPLFGHKGLTFHTKIPLLRRLWEYKTYRLAELEDLDAGLEDLEWDYPISRWRKKIAEPLEAALAKLGLRKLSKSYADHVKSYVVERESDELIRELFLAQMELKEQLKSAEMEWAKAHGEKSSPRPSAEGLFRRALSKRSGGRRQTDEES